jgi:hypothetical protein
MFAANVQLLPIKSSSSFLGISLLSLYISDLSLSSSSDKSLMDSIGG